MQEYLFKNRNNFVDQVENFRNIQRVNNATEEIVRPNNLELTSRLEEIETLVSCLQEENNLAANVSKQQQIEPAITDEDAFQTSSLENASGQCISTSDLISWSFQIARGMDYLAKKKVILMFLSIT